MVKSNADVLYYLVWRHALKVVENPVPYFESIALYNFIAPDYTFPVRSYIVPVENVLKSYKGRGEFIFIIFQDDCNRKILYVSESVYESYSACLEAMKIRVAYFGLFAYGKRFILKNKH